MNQIICGNSIKIMSEYPTNYVDMVFTSPPYNTGGKGQNKGLYAHYQDNLSDIDYFNLLKSSILSSLAVCNGLCFYNLGYMTNNKKVLFQICYELNEYLREIIIWDKLRVQPPIGNILGKRYEFIFVFSKDKKIQINNFRKNLAAEYKEEFGSWISNVIQLPPTRKPVKTHQACFPIKLPSIFIDIYTCPGDIILDPFMGTGTTCLAAKLLYRNYIGIDVSQEYCDFAQKRIDNA